MLLVYCQIQSKGKGGSGVYKEEGRRREHMPENQIGVCCTLNSQERGSGATAEGSRVIRRQVAEHDLLSKTYLYRFF